jgi:hypothetical protein
VRLIELVIAIAEVGGVRIEYHLSMEVEVEVEVKVKDNKETTLCSFNSSATASDQFVFRVEVASQYALGS